MDLAGVRKARNLLLEIDELKQEVQKENQELRKHERELKSLKKAQEDEIASKVKAQKSVIHHTYDEVVSHHKSALKKVKSERERERDKKMEKRIAFETEPLQEENQKIHAGLKLLFKEHKVPGFVNSKLYFSLYFTQDMSEFLTLMLMVLVFIVFMPYGIYFLIGKGTTLSLILSYAGSFIVIGALYIYINNITKVKHLEVLKEARVQMTELRKNERNMKKVKRSVSKDNNDEQYGLEKYDEEIRTIEADIAKVEGERNAELKEFEGKGVQKIESEVQEKTQDAILAEEDIVVKMSEGILTLEQKVKDSNLIFTKEYETYLGKEFRNVHRLNEIIAIMENGGALTFMEALNIYKTEGKGIDRKI